VLPSYGGHFPRRPVKRFSSHVATVLKRDEKAARELPFWIAKLSETLHRMHLKRRTFVPECADCLLLLVDRRLIFHNP
jgi:hypothetical protein